MLHDEACVVPPGVAVALHPLLERDDRHLLLTEKPGTYAEKKLRPHKQFIYAIADNTKGVGDSTGLYNGTTPQNAAFMNRCDVMLEIGYLPVAEEVEVLTKNTSVSRHVAEKYVQLATLIRKAVEEGKLRAVMSTRTLMDLCEKIDDFDGNSVLAFKVVYFNKLDSDEERTAVAGFFSSVFGMSL
jgi:MoxR-like ATPase